MELYGSSVDISYNQYVMYVLDIERLLILFTIYITDALYVI